MLFVEDLKHAKRFYGDLLGLIPEEQADDFASYRVGASSLQLHPAGQPFPGLILGRSGPGVAVQVTLDVEDVDTAVNYLRAEGVQVFSEPQDREGKRDAGVLDPDGNEVYLSQSPS
jgi:predicted enzyme related to lactoylglutathione lyase